MIRFWPTLGIVCLFAGFFALVVFGLVSSRHRIVIDPQGQWFGPWPMEGADDCRTKLFPNGSFEMECRGKQKYAGTGQWSRESNQLKFEFKLYVREGLQVRDPKPMVFRMDGVRNTMCLGAPGERGEPHCWQRGRP